MYGGYSNIFMKKQFQQFKQWTETKKIQSALKALNIIGLCFVTVLLFVVFSKQITAFAGMAREKVFGISTTKPTPIPTINPVEMFPTDTPSPYPTETTNTRNYVYPTVNPDPIINCTIQKIGVQQMPRSQCNISFACQIGSTWYVYTSRDKCSQDQRSQTTNNGYVPPNYTYPTYAPYPTSAPYVYQSPTPNQQSIDACKANCQQLEQAYLNNLPGEGNQAAAYQQRLQCESNCH